MTKRHSKFNQGDLVKVRKDLVIGERYSVESSDEYEIFSSSMIMSLGRKATVMEVDEFGRYKLDIDEFFYYTDGMLIRILDSKAQTEYDDIEEVELLIKKVSELLPDQQINHAIDTGNVELFMDLTELHADYLLTKSE